MVLDIGPQVYVFPARPTRVQVVLEALEQGYRAGGPCRSSAGMSSMKPCRASAERKQRVVSGARGDGLEVMVAAGEVSRLLTWLICLVRDFRQERGARRGSPAVAGG
jgi:hypothetical protein